MQSFDTLIWDRNRRKRMKPLDLFQSSAAFDAAVRDAFCAGIKRAKAAKGIEEAPDSVFAECPPASAQTVWLGSSDGRYLDRSEEHTSELQSLMRISYAVFCL